jgi:WD40 repeat protein
MGNTTGTCCKEESPDPFQLDGDGFMVCPPNNKKAIKAGYADGLNLSGKQQQKQQQTVRVFLSHNWGVDTEQRDNHARARTINTALKASGIDTWFDEQGDMKGEIVQAMTNGIDNCDVIVVCVTRAYIDKCKKEGADHCKLEFNYAYNRKGPNLMIPLVMEDDCMSPATWDGPVGAILGAKLYLSFSDDRAFLGDLQRLYEEILTIYTESGKKHALKKTVSALALVKKKVSALALVPAPPVSQQVVNDQADKALAKLLTPLDFTPEINEHEQNFCEGTRLWILGDVEKWAKTPNPSSRVYAFMAVKGIGKSAVSAQLASKDFVAAHFFCRHDDSRKRDAKTVVTSLAYQLSRTLPEYNETLMCLMEQRNWTNRHWRMASVHEVFDTLLCETLSMISSPSEPVAVIIDAVDECEHNGRCELLKVIRNRLGSLPKWLRIIITSRPSSGSGQVNDILNEMTRFNSHEIQAESEANMGDILLFARKMLQGKLAGDIRLDAAAAALAEKSDGRFLFLKLVHEKFKGEDKLSPEAIHELPAGLVQILSDELEDRVQTLANDEELKIMRRCLAVMIAAQEPLMVKFLPAILGYDELTTMNIVGKLSLFFPVRNQRLHIYHKCVSDWLTDPLRQAGSLSVDINEGHELLAAHAFTTIKHLKTHAQSGGKVARAASPLRSKRGSVSGVIERPIRRVNSYTAPGIEQATALAELDLWELYALRHGVLHMVAAMQGGNLVQTLCDIRYIEVKAHNDLALELANEYNTALACSSKPYQDAPASSPLIIKTPSDPHSVDSVGLRPRRRSTSLPSPKTKEGMPLGNQVSVEQAQRESIMQFYRFVMEFGVLIKSRPHLIIQCAMNWLEGLQPAIQSKLELSDRKDYVWLKAAQKPSVLSPLLLAITFDGGVVLAVDFSSDGMLVAAGGGSGMFRIWDAVSGHQVQAFRHLDAATALSQRGVVMDLHFIGDGSRIASAGTQDAEGYTVKIWDALIGDMLLRIKDDTSLLCRSVFSSSNGEKIAVAFTPNAKVMDTTTGEVLLSIEHGLRLNCIAFSPTDALIASGAYNSTSVHVWETATGQQLHSLPQEGEKRVWAVSFSPCGTRLASAGRSVCIWDAVEGTLLMRFAKGSLSTIRSVTLMEQQVVSCGHDGLIKMWDTLTRKQSLGAYHNVGNVYSCACDLGSDGTFVRRIASGGSDNTLKIWIVDKGKRVIEQQEEDTSVKITAVDVSADGHRFATAGSNQVAGSLGVVRVWDMRTAEELLHFGTASKVGGESWTEVRFSPCGSQVAAASDGNSRLVLWEVATGKQLLHIPRDAATYDVGSLCFSPCGKRIMLGSTNEARIWHTETGTELMCIDTASLHLSTEKQETCGEFSPNGLDIALVGGGSDIAIWCASSGAPKKRWEACGKDCSVIDLRYSPAGDRIVTCGKPSMIQIWDAVSFEELLVMKAVTGDRGLYPADPCLSSCGTKLLCAGDFGVLIDVATKKVLHSINTYGSARTRVRFSPDASLIVSGAENGNIRVIGLDNQVKSIVCQAHQPDKMVTIRALPGNSSMSVSSSKGTTIIQLQRASRWGMLSCRIEGQTAIRILAGSNTELGYVDTKKNIEIAGFVSESCRQSDAYTVMAITEQGHVMEFTCCGLA